MAGAEVPTAAGLGVAVGLGVGEAPPSSGVGLRVESSDVGEGEPVGNGVVVPANGVTVGEGRTVAVAWAVAVGTPPVGLLVGLGEGEGGVADGSGGEVGAGGGLVGWWVGRSSVGLAVGGMTVGLFGVIVGTVWLGRLA